jgi:hypothetical protein
VGWLIRVFSLTAAAATLGGQPLRVFSEYQRVTPAGVVARLDRGEVPREINSPAVVRNAWLTLRVAVSAPPGESYTLHVSQNPEDTARPRLYQEHYERLRGEWVADRLSEAPLPHTASLEPEQKVQTYLLDLWIPAATPVDRFRLEIQMHLGGHWFLYPLEMRPRWPVVPDQPSARGRLAPPAARADATLLAPLKGFVCAAGPPRDAALEESSLTVRHLVLRNALQDLALAAARAENEGRDKIAAALVAAAGYASRDELCGDSPALPPRGAEWFLKARDYLYQALPVR